MNARLLVTSAGSGASGNLVRSLRAGNAAVVIVGCHDDQFILKNSTADHNYLVPPLSHPTWARSLCRVVDTERIDLVIPTSDPDVAALSRVRGRLAGRVFLPRAAHVSRDGPSAPRACLRATGQPVPSGVPDPRGSGLARRGAGGRTGAGPELDQVLARHAWGARLGVHPVRVPAR